MAVPIEEQLKRANGRSAFLRLIRQALALVVIGVLLHQQPFMAKSGPGHRSNHKKMAEGRKVVPLHLVMSAAFRWADSSPLVVSTPSLQDGINITSRSLLTPLEYVKAPTSRRTLGAAYGKTQSLLRRIVDVNSTHQKLAAAPSPNVPVIGAYLLTSGSGLATLLPGAELLVVGGCGCLLFGCPGMSSQPELYFVILLAVLGLAARREAAKPPVAKAPKKRSSKSKSKARAEPTGEPKSGCCH